MLRLMHKFNVIDMRRGLGAGAPGGAWSSLGELCGVCVVCACMVRVGCVREGCVVCVVCVVYVVCVCVWFVFVVCVCVVCVCVSGCNEIGFSKVFLGFGEPGVR